MPDLTDEQLREVVGDAEFERVRSGERLRDLMEPVPFDPVREAGERLADEARAREAQRERARGELEEAVRDAVRVARDALGRDAVNPVALATLASAVLGRRFLG